MKKILIVVTACFALACGSDGENSNGAENENNDGFNRKSLLIDVADNMIIPAYDALWEQTIKLELATKQFIENPDIATFDDYRAIWKNVYQAYQKVALFDIGKAEAISYHNFMNTYPTNAMDIEANILDGSYDLGLASEQDEQGLAALDYMLYGIGTTDEAIIAKYTTDPNASKYKEYVVTLATRIKELTETVTLDWKNSYRETFVNNSGSDATSSFNKLVNDYLFYFEKHLRAGKIGIPAGVFSEGTTFSEKTEAFYNGEISKELFLIGLDAAQNFYNGKYFDGNGQGESIKSYVTYLNNTTGSADLNAIINQQFDDARTVAQGLDNNLSAQVTSNNKLMLQTYDALQKNVITMKVDLLSALSVRVDYVDADGD